MGMPRDLVLIRHGESEGNVATNRSKTGDDSLYTEEFITTPGHRWRLTPTGVAQAAAAGAWLAEQFTGGRFDRYYVSPYVRTRETAAHLGLPDARWRLNRALRERDWGDIGTVPRTQFETSPEFRLNARVKRTDPLYWVAPGGESIAGVSEDRVRNFLDTLHRECAGERVVAVTHGDVLLAVRLVLERMDDETFVEMDADKSQRILNCEVLHYTRIDPETGVYESRVSWLRRAHPETDPGSGAMRMVVGDWQRIRFQVYDNDALLAAVREVPHLFD